MRTSRRMSVSRAVLAAGMGLLACAMAQADSACLLTPAELQSLTGRAFSEGQIAKDPGDGSPLCHYPQSDNPRRKLTIAVTSSNAQRRFEAHLRLLNLGKDSIEVEGVGDRAYYNGTSAGVLSGNKLITISNLRRGADPKIAADKVVAMLQVALKKAESL